MKRDRMFGTGLMRLAACAMVVFVCAGSAWGGKFGETNPSYIRWQKIRELKRNKSQTNFVSAVEIIARSRPRRSKRLLSSASTRGTEEILIPDEVKSPLGYMPSPNDKTYLKNINVTSSRAVQRSMGAVTSLPARFDLRTSSRVTAVKNQGSYGTCWAHGTMASIESGLLTSKAEAFDLSEKQLALNHGWDMGYKGFTAGGNGDIAASFLTQWKGPILESQDPYPDNSYYSQWYPDYTNGNVYALNSILPASPNVMPIGHVQHIRWIPAMSTNMTAASIKSELVPIKLALMEFGALYVDYFHCQYFYGDFDGKYQTIQQDGKNYYYGSSWMDTYFFDDDREIYEYFELGGGHAVTIVGWDDNFSRDNFRYTPPGDGAFIVKNSWGEDFGIDGYFYVSYYDRYFAKGELMSFAGIEAVDNYSAIYQYDPMGYVRPYHPNSNGGETAWGANVFVATNNAPLAAVGFYALSPNTSYQIAIYTSCSADDPTSGNQKLKQTGVTDYAGFVTVPLTDTVALTRGTRFSVVLKLTTPGKNEPLALEGLYYYETRTASANIGESFISEDGKAWGDLASIRMDYGTGSYNFCCKAYTKSATAPKPTLASIVISGVASLTSGQSAQFSCEAIYTDQSKKDISPTWSITRAGQAYATVSASGLVTAKEVSAQQTVTVQATYTEDGITKDATWGMFVTIAAPNTPTDVTATQGTETSCVRVNWIAPNGATEYAVYRATANNSRNAQYLDKVTVPKYNDTSAVPGVDYWYFVKAKNSSGASGFSDGANGWRKLAPPESVTASDTLLDKVALEWSEVEGATHYRVYRAESIDGEKTALGNWQAATTFDDTTATAGVTYYYFVVAAVDASGNRPSDYSIVEDGMRAEPVRVASLAINGAASIASGGNATYTATAAYTDGTTRNVSPTWSLASGGTSYATLSGATVTAKTMTANQSVTLQAVYTEGGITVTANKAITITAVVPSVPTGLTLVSQTTSGISFRWNATAGATSYKIYRAIGSGTASSIGTVAATSFTDSTAVPGVTYAYSVSAVNGAGESARSATVSGTVPLAVPAGVTATGDRTDGVRVSWQAVNGASYYRVSRTTSATGTKTDLGSWQTGTSYLDTSATAGTRYWYFVRAATSSGGANASGYSASAQGVRKVQVTLSSISISGPDKVSASKTAMYTCTAAYSDGTSKSVSPTWSVSGAATIDANGKLTANAVSANSTATVVASFTDGTTKTANKAVTVIAPIRATAEVRNINVASRWPFSSLLDIDYELVTDPARAKAMVNVIGHDEDHNVDMAAKTLSGDGANGSYIAAGQHRLTWNIGADYTNFHARAFSVTMTATPSIIGVPENVTVSASTSGVTLNWSAVEDATGYEVWRGTGTTTNDATRIATVTGATTYFDGTGTAGTTYRYWLRASGEDGMGEFAQPVTGMRVLTVTISFNGNGGTASTSSQSYTAYGTYGSLPTATRLGYTFAGWWTESSGGTQATTTSTVPAAATTLWAHWTANGDGSTYLVIDLSGGASASSYPVTTMSSAPSGGWTDEYKTTKLVLRKIPAGSYVMGSDQADESHRVTLTKPFYIGVFEVTQRQWELVMGEKPSYFNNVSYYAARPVEQVSYDIIRGSSSGAGWPGSSAVDATSFIGNLRAKTGIDEFDLPTEAQWEYACRAGTTTDYNNGKNYANSSQDAAMDEVGRYWNNGGQTHSSSCTTEAGTAKVGSYLPNAWGLYDMHGNVLEWCLDWYGTLAYGTDPKGSSSGSYRMLRGGCWSIGAGNCASSYRLSRYYPSISFNSYGFRLARTLSNPTGDSHAKVQLWEGGPYWATTNIGAENPEDYGYYFWWGDTVGYKRENNKWVAMDGSSSNFSFIESNTPTCNKSIATLQSEGWITADSVLAPAHDAARVHWGGNWRMPMKQELDNLNSKCDWTWTTQNGVNGFIVRGRGDYASNSIFLPCAGVGSGTSLSNAGSHGFYWSSVPSSDSNYDSWSLRFDSGSHYAYSGYYRGRGQSVRPVQGFTE